MFSSTRLILLPILFISSTLLFSILFTGCTTSEQVTDEEAVELSRDRDLSHLEEVYWSRIESSRMNFTQSDIDFMTGMIGHHAQALIMSRLAPKNGASRSVQVLASRIINAQGDEIRLMQQWLADRDQPVPQVQIDGLNLMIHMPEMEEDEGDHHAHHDNHAMHDHSDMPGMLTQEQLEELDNAQGREFDRLFLLYMIEHHEGAITMVETLFNADGAAGDREIFDLATGINAEQITEINRMRSMLEEMEES